VYQQRIHEVAAAGGALHGQLFFAPVRNSKSASMFGWIEWIVESNLPFSIVTQQTYRRYSNLEPTSVKSVVRTMRRLVARVEDGVKHELSSRASFGLEFDGWGKRHMKTKYVALLAVHNLGKPTMGVDGKPIVPPMLAFAPLLDEEKQTAAEHIAWFESTLRIYNKTLDDVKFIVADNCSVNKAIADLLRCGFIGCASHRLHLSVMLEVTKPIDDILEKIDAIMIKYSTVKYAAKLRALTPLAAKLRNKTRWNETYAELDRYVKLQPHFGAADAEIAPLLLSPNGTPAHSVDDAKTQRDQQSHQDSSVTRQSAQSGRGS